jgi:serine/threonine protein kinase
MPPSFERLKREGITEDDHRHASTMRYFLEDKNLFHWPEEAVQRPPKKQGEESHPDPTVRCFKTRDEADRLLVWERHLNCANKGGTIWLEQRRFSLECQEKTNFKRCIVIKGYVNVSPQRRDKMVEAANMKDLKHPHVAALLGTCSYPANFWILSYPPGGCDLGDYMASISQELGGRQWRGKTWTLERQPLEEKEVRAHQIHHEYCWPFRESLSQKLTRLRGYFVCLAQALAYLKVTDLRHRDIKPDNVIIDLSGSVVVVDFGLAHKFPPNTAQTSQSSTQWSFLVYQAPEVLDGEERGPYSDIFSLGCIYLEMASLILGKNLQICEERCSHEVNQTARNFNYGDNLPRVADWITDLKQVTQVATGDGLAPPPSDMIDKLSTIELMLSKDAHARPQAHGLWRSFDVAVEKRCRDCHPEHPDVWRPTQEQANAATSAAVGMAKRSLSFQFDESRLRENRERETKTFTAQARRAGVAGEPLVRSSSPGPILPSPMSSPRRRSLDPPARSASPALTRKPTPRLEQQQHQHADGKIRLAPSANEQSMHTETSGTPQNEPGTASVAHGAGSKNLVPTDSEKLVLKKADGLPYLLKIEDSATAEDTTGGSSEALTPIKEEKRVQFRDAAASVMSSSTATLENSSQPSIYRDVSQDMAATPLTPETGALVLRQQEVTRASKQPEVIPILNETRVNFPQNPSEKIIVYDEGEDDLYTNTNRILRGRFTFHWYRLSPG